MNEKLKEKFEVTVTDEIINLNIYSSQKKLNEYTEKFEMFFDGQHEFTHEVSVHLGKTLMEFDTEEFKNKRLMLSEKLNKEMQKTFTPYDG